LRFLTIALAVLFGLSGSAQQSVPAGTGTLVESKIPAAPLKGNLLGDPAEARVSTELAARGIGHTFEVYEGGDHMNLIANRIETRVLRFFSDVLSPDNGPSR